MKPVPISSVRRLLLQLVYFSGLSLSLGLLLFIATPSSAQTPASPSGSVPTASQLQRAHDLGQAMASRHFDAEVFPHGGPPPKDLLRPRFDEFMTADGARFSDAEKEVFTEAYWSKYEKRADRLRGGMTQIDAPTLLGPDTSTTTTVSGKTTTPGPGTLQLTDAKGNSYFVDVDPNGNYEVTVPQPGFQPIKMTFRSPTLKAAWQFTQNGTWEQVSAATGTGTQGTMVPGRSSVLSAGQQFALAQDECNRYVLLASLSPDPHIAAKRSQVLPPPFLLPVRFGAADRPVSPNQPPPLARLVSDPLPPEVVDQMNKLGKDIADYEHQKETLERELRENKDAKTGKPLNRDEFKQRQTDLDNVKNKLKNAEQNKQFISDDARKVAEDAYKARKAQYALPEQIRQLRAKGDPTSLQQADMMERQLQALNQFYGPLASLIVPSGQSGYARLGSAAATGNGQTSMKGHSKLVATGDIKQQTTTELTLEPLAHLEEEPSATSSFAQYFGYNLTSLSWGKPNLSLAADWGAADTRPPHVTAVGEDGRFEITNWTAAPKTCYKLNVSYGYDHVSTAISPQTSAHTYDVTFNINSSWIAGFKQGIDINQFQADYMKAGQVDGAQYTWTHWHTPFQDVPMISSGQISDDGYSHMSWESPYKNFMVYGELSPGTNPLPVPGLTPADWPNGAANPIPVLVLSGTWIKE